MACKCLRTPIGTATQLASELIETRKCKSSKKGIIIIQTTCKDEPRNDQDSTRVNLRGNNASKVRWETLSNDTSRRCRHKHVIDNGLHP
jgi:hypothetical protein